MKNIIITLLVAIVGAFALVGCTNLVGKDVVLENTVQGFKVTSAVDPTTGTVAPQVSAGWGSNLLITMNTDKPGTLEWKKKSGSFFGSVFGIEVSDETELRITAGDSKVTVTSKTDAGKTVTTEVGNGTVAVNVVDDAVISSNTAAVAAEAAKVAAATTDGTASTDAAKVDGTE